MSHQRRRNLNEKLTLHGHYTVEGYDGDGNLVERHEVDNLITTALYAKILNFLNQAFLNQASASPAVADLNITHMATGTGTASPSQADTAMGTELFRKAPASKIAGTNMFTCKLILLPAESNGTITELGVFSNGTDTAGSGTLISHASCNIVKTATTKYLLTWKLTLA